ncbi:MAG: YdcF family protein [Flavobacteriales bacterium]|nr:YdcF family protein [Flavobacteriales bacterium]
MTHAPRRSPYIGCALLSLLLVGCTIAKPHAYYAKAYAKRPYDAVIVPGVPFVNGSWDRIMRARLMWSIHLYRQGVVKNIICSGSAVYSPYVEGGIMRLYAIALGVPPEHVFVEPKAEHSTENLYYGWRLARSMRFERIAIATDPFQSKMLKKFNRRMHRRTGANVDLIPIVFDTLGTLDHTDPVIDPSPAFVEDFTALPDRESFWKRFRGTLGKNIDWKAGE